MATGLKSRIIFREKTKEITEEDYWAGTYRLLIKAKSIPSPFGSPNMVDASTLEDLSELQEFGRASANQMDVVGAFEKLTKDQMVEVEDKDLDFVILYGTSGKGDVGMAAFTGGVRFVPGEATDGHLEGTASISVQSTPVWIEDKYTVTVVEDAFGYPSEITLAQKQ